MLGVVFLEQVGVEGVAGEDMDEKDDEKDDAGSPGDDGPSPGVEAEAPVAPPPKPNLTFSDK